MTETAYGASLRELADDDRSQVRSALQQMVAHDHFMKLFPMPGLAQAYLFLDCPIDPSIGYERRAVDAEHEGFSLVAISAIPGGETRWPMAALLDPAPDEDITWLDSLSRLEGHFARCLVIVTSTINIRELFKPGTDYPPTKDPDAGSRLRDRLLRTASYALKSASLVRGNPGDLPAFGPIARGDLAHDGIIRIESINGGQVRWHEPLHARPRYGGHLLGKSQDATNFQDNLRSDAERARIWSHRMFLREARGEWDEAIVALEASAEQILGRYLDHILVDHGWSLDDFAQFDASGPVLLRRLPKILRHHLGGGGWDSVDSSIQRIYDARNEVVHRGAIASEGRLRNLREDFKSVLDHLERRVNDESVLRKHPLTALAFAPDALSAVLRISVEEIREHVNAQLRDAEPDLFDAPLRATNDRWQRRVVQVGEEGPDANRCWEKVPALRAALSLP